MKSPQSNQDENTITSILYDPTSDCVPRRLSRSHSQITAVMHRRYRPYAVVRKRKWLHPKCTVHGRRRSRHAISPSSIIQVVGKKLRSFQRHKRTPYYAIRERWRLLICSRCVGFVGFRGNACFVCGFLYIFCFLAYKFFDLLSLKMYIFIQLNPFKSFTVKMIRVQAIRCYQNC